jgi:hypothetical protein
MQQETENLMGGSVQAIIREVGRQLTSNHRAENTPKRADEIETRQSL